MTQQKWWFGADFAVRVEDVARVVKDTNTEDAGVFVILREEAPGDPKYIRTSMPLPEALASWKEQLGVESEEPETT